MCVSVSFVLATVEPRIRALTAAARRKLNDKTGLKFDVCNSSNSYCKNYVVSVMLNVSAGVRDAGAMSRIPGTTFGADASMGGTRSCF